MSSFNKIDKVQYTKKQIDVVSLSEYIIFTDEKNNQKYTVLKLNNNVNQILEELKIEISQYDEEGRLLAKNTINHVAKTPACDEFVPKAKLPLMMECVKIEYELLYARFERTEWKDGEFTPIPFTLNDFKTVIDEKPKEKKEKTVKKTNIEEKKKKVKKSKKPFNIKYISLTNGLFGSKIGYAILLILMIALTVGGVYYYSINSNEYYNGEFQYEVKDDNVIITDVDTTKKHIIIPVLIDNKEVVRIDTDAFAFSNIEEVEIYSERIVLEKGAFRNAKKLRSITQKEGSTVTLKSNVFENCINLETVNLPSVRYVYYNTFKNCKSLESLDMPDASFYKESLVGCTNLKDLTYNRTINTNFYQLFGSKVDSVPSSLKTVTNNMDHISKDYFGESKSIVEVNLKDENCSVEFGAYKGLSIPGYFCNDYVEFIDGEVIVNPNVSEIKIDNDIPSSYIDEILVAISESLPYLSSISLDYSNSTISASSFYGFNSLQTLTISSETKIEKGSFNQCYNLTTIVVNGKNNIDVLSNISSPYVEALFVNGQDLDINNPDIFMDLPNLRNVQLSGVKNITKYVFKPLYNLSILSMPYIDYTLNDLGISNSIFSIAFNGILSTRIPSGYINGYHNLERIEFPEGIKFVDSEAISDASNLRLVSFPNSVEQMNGQVIGYGCINLSKVITPFVGNDSSSMSSYSKWNKSFHYTRYLVVTGKTYGGKLFSGGLQNVVGIRFDDEVADINDLLTNCQNIEYLSFKNQSNIEYLGLNKRLDWLYLNNVSDTSHLQEFASANNVYFDEKTNTSLLDIKNLLIESNLYFQADVKIEHDGNLFVNYDPEYNGTDIDTMMTMYIG